MLHGVDGSREMEGVRIANVSAPVAPPQPGGKEAAATAAAAAAPLLVCARVELIAGRLS